MKSIISQLVLITLIFTFNLRTAFAQNTITLSEGTVLTVSTITTDVTTPWEIVARPNNKIWVTERNLGYISEFDIVTGVKRVIYEIPLNERVPPEFAGVGGTMGMVLHPDFDSGTPEVYVSLTNQDFVYALYKYEYDGTTFINREVVLTTALASGNTGARLMIGEDRKIYMTTGGENDENPQLLTNRVGKILRINLDGTAPTDNPYYDLNNPTSNQSYIYSYGHRNPQGITQVPSTDALLGGAIYSAEHGEVQNDEVNKIIAGHNYGWADYEGWTNVISEDNHPPLITFDLAPTGIQWYDHPAIPEWSRKLLMGTSKGGVLMVWTPTTDGLDLVDRNPAGASSNNVNITNQNTFSFTFGSIGTSPRCITPLPDGRIIIGAFSNPHRIIMLENQDYEPNLLSWIPSTLEFGDLEGGIHNATATLSNNTNETVNITELDMSPSNTPFSISNSWDFPIAIPANESISVNIQFEAYSESVYNANLIATSEEEQYVLNINGEISVPTNDNILTLNEGTELSISVLTSDVSRPWDIELENDYLWVTERDLGRVGRINLNTGIRTTVLTLESQDLPPAVGSTAGLLGMALHPDFSGDFPWIYLAHTNDQSQQTLSRYSWNGNSLVDKQILLTITDTPNLYGSRLEFLPDDTLLWTTGADNSNLAQSTTSLAGKVLRLTATGGVPIDNPFAASAIENERYIYTLGHRNVQGLTVWTNNEAETHIMISEHGQEANDEVNLIVPGDNYGWPDYEGWANQITSTNHPPQVTFDLAPTGMHYYNHPAIPEWQHSLLLGTSKGQRLLTLGLGDELEVENHNPLLASNNTLELNNSNNYFFYNNGQTDRPRDIEVGEDGRIFLAMFGGTGDDRILVLENESYNESLSIFNQSNSVQIYPNPVNQFINIKTEESNLNNLSIYDINGRKVNFNSLNNGKTINTNNISPGLYIIVIKLQKETQYFKFVKK